MSSPKIDSDSGSPWHSGERAVQARMGVRAQMEKIGPVALRAYMPEQHRDFFSQLPFVIAGSVDAAGQPWASVLARPPGFIASSGLDRYPERGRSDGVRLSSA